MKLYDSQGLDNEITELDLGIIEVGSVKEYTFYVVNDTKATLEDLVFKINHSEVEINKAPKTLKPDEMGRIELQWNSEVKIEEGLKTKLIVTASEIWG